MTQDEQNKLYIARCLLNGKMAIGEAAEILGLSERQVKRIKKEVKKQGDAFVIHKNRGRKPAYALTDEIKDLVVGHKILKEKLLLPKAKYTKRYVAPIILDNTVAIAAPLIPMSNVKRKIGVKIIFKQDEMTKPVMAVLGLPSARIIWFIENIKAKKMVPYKITPK